MDEKYIVNNNSRTITKIKIVSQNKWSVQGYIREWAVSKRINTKYTKLFDTFQKSKEYLINREINKINKCKSELEYHKTRLAEINNIREM